MPNELVKQDGGELTVLQVIADVCRDPTVSMDRVERLVALQERIMDRESEQAFNQAMHDFQAELPAIIKATKAHTANYAKLEDIDKICQPFLTKFGFSVSYDSAIDPKGVVYKCIVKHVRGHKETTSSPPLPADDCKGNMNNVQRIFSAASYGERRAFCAAFKIVPRGQDDDGAATGWLTEDHLETLTSLANDAKLKPGTDEMEAFLAYAGADKLAHVPEHAYSRCVMALQGKIRAKESAAKTVGVK